MEPKDIENPIAELDFRSQLKAEKEVIKISSNTVLADSNCYHTNVWIDDYGRWWCSDCKRFIYR